MAKKILIVDDDQEIWRVLKVLFKANNYETAFVGDAVSAIAVARKENPDLIILDIGLPGGEGFMVLQRLRSLVPLASIPVIVLSGRDPESNEERALQAGAKAFLQKPPDHDELLATVHKALGEAGMALHEAPAKRSVRRVQRGPALRTRNERKHARIAVKMIACIRRPGLGEEVVHVENVSRAGFLFMSVQIYEKGSLVEVAAPYTPGEANVFVTARIVRYQEQREKKLRKYGVEYTKTHKERPGS